MLCGIFYWEFGQSGTSRYSIIVIMGQVCPFFCLVCSEQSAYLALLIDLGKVLAGIQVPPHDYFEFDAFLLNLGYPYVEETENEVYRRHLRG